jgi:hypothetical protein
MISVEYLNWNRLDNNTSRPKPIGGGFWIPGWLNNESNSMKIRNEGAQLWILGYKTENPATALTNLAGAASEILGGFLYPLDSAKAGTPLYINDQSALSFIHTYDTTWMANKRRPVCIVREVRGGQTQDVNPIFPTGARMNKLMYVTNPDSIGSTGVRQRAGGRAAGFGAGGGRRLTLLDRKTQALSIGAFRAGALNLEVFRSDGSKVGGRACRPNQVVSIGSVGNGLLFARLRGKNIRIESKLVVVK